MRTGKRTDSRSSILLTLLLAAVGLAFIYPFVFMISSSFKPSGDVMKYPLELIPRTITLNNYLKVFNEKVTGFNFWGWYRNTIVMTALVLAFKTAVVTITGYAFAKINFRFKNVIFLLLLSSLMIPADIMIIPRYVIFSSLRIIDTVWALVLPGTFDIYFVFLMRQFFVAIPESLIEAAKIDGYAHFQIFRKIALPLAVPAVVTMVLFTFVWAWNDYMSPYIFISDTKKQMLSVGMQLFTVGSRQDYGAQMAAATLVLLPIIGVFLFCQNLFVEGIATTGVKG